MEVVVVKNLSFKYAGSDEYSLSDVSFSVGQGELVVLCGATGSGKSTLLRMLKRELVPEGDRRGDVVICGTRQDELSPRDAASKVGLVFQDPERQTVCDKVWHELAFGLENLGYPVGEIRRRVAETASFFGIEGIFDKKIAELSGGQKQLTALASVMAMRPSVLLLDEPTSRLDPIARAEFISTVSRLCRETGITVIIAEHSLGDLLGICDRLMALDGGRIVSFDAPRNAVPKIKDRRALSLTLPCAPRIYLETGSVGECPLDISSGQKYIQNNFKNDIREISDNENKSPGEPALELKNVFFRYKKTDPDALCDVSLSIGRGEIFAILGGNGSGKTTLLSLSAGLLSPYSGKVCVFGKKISEYKNQTLYKNCVSMLFQDVQTVFVRNTVGEDLADVGGKDFKLPYDITHLYNKHPYDLSGGEQQLAALGKVLLTKPRLLLLDEPTKGLDGAAKEDFISVLKKLRDDGTTIVIVTHDTDLSARVADRCAMIFCGEIMSVSDRRSFFCENSFYTTEAARISRGYYDGAVTVDDVSALCKRNGRRE